MTDFSEGKSFGTMRWDEYEKVFKVKTTWRQRNSFAWGLVQTLSALILIWCVIFLLVVVL
jgi:hypothetical protein